MIKSATKMKTILALVMVMIMLISSSIPGNGSIVYAKGKSGAAASVSKEELLKKRTSAYVSQFIQGNFEDFYNDSSKEFKQKITLSTLQKGWNESILVLTGKPVKSISCTYAKQNNIYILQDTIEGTLFNILITLQYDKKEKPLAIRTNIIPKDPPKPQTTDKWQEFPVTVGDMKLPGMLTVPRGVEKPPVVILVQGSGASDMNESIGAAPNRPFEDIAHGLADQGVATLRYNKRNYQYLGDPSGDTIEWEELNDAAAAAKMLSTDTRIDTNRIYLLGHSLGGMMAPKITSDNPEIKGFISMAGTLRTYQEISLDQMKALINETPSLTEQQKNDYLTQHEANLERTKTYDDGGTNFILGIPTNYWRSLNAIDSVSIVKNLTVPMLILQGSADFQISADKDYTLWQSTLKDRTNVTYHLYEGLSHLFMPNQLLPEHSIPNASVYNAPNHIEPQVITDIATWVKGLS
jgi:Lysophospholipase